MHITRSLRIIGAYVLCAAGVLGYVLLENSSAINAMNEKGDEFRVETGFFMFVTTGLLKYGLLLIGLCLFIFLTLFLLRKAIEK